jgi:site-specific DNA-methyltransferase (adenine-specific)
VTLPTVIRADVFEYGTTIADESVPLIIADPPYGDILPVDWDRGQPGLYDRLATLVERLLVPGGTAYLWGGIGKPGNRVFFDWLARVEQATALRIHTVITWSKKRAYGRPDTYLFTREECAMLVKGDKPRTFNIPLLDVKRGYPGFNKDFPAKSEYLRRTNVWTDVTEIFKGKIHRAEKPARLAEIMIETSSRPGELVFDPMAGSGSTGVAAVRLGRPCVLVEVSDCRMHDFATVEVKLNGAAAEPSPQPEEEVDPWS